MSASTSTFIAQFLEKDEKTNRPVWRKAQYRIPADAKPLGSGGYGTVFKAIRVLEDGTVDEKQCVAVKKFDQKKSEESGVNILNKKEAEFLSCYDAQASVCVDSKGLVTDLVSELKPGVNLLEYVKNTIRAHPKNPYINLFFSQKINYICQLALQLNLLHHHTASTGSALIHKDIKVANILVDDLTHRITLIDMGLCQELQEEDSELHKTCRSGSSLTISPEVVLSKKAGTKSDLFSFSSIISFILTGENPYTYRTKDHDKLKKHSFEFDLSSLDNLKIPAPFPPAIKPLLIQFVKRMASIDYTKRPDSDETLRFFRTLRLCETTDETIQVIHLAKLKLLAAGLWNNTLEKKDFYQPSEEKDEKSTTPLKYKHKEFCEKVLSHSDTLLPIGVKIEFKLSLSVLREALEAYDAHKKSGLFRWTSGESVKTADALLSKKLNDEDRYDMAIAYIHQYPKKSLSLCLYQAMQDNSTITPDLSFPRRRESIQNRFPPSRE